MEKNRKLRKNGQKRAVLLLLLVTLLVLTAGVGGTYAWFVFNTATNIEPSVGSTISGGEASLLMANNLNGPFGNECDLVFMSNGGDLQPLSTADLSHFYRATAQNAKGISLLYADADDKVDSSTMHGSLFFRAEGGSLDVYLLPEQLFFGNDIQALSAMRLGVRIVDGVSSTPLIFKLDEMADTGNAAKTQTTTRANAVVAGIDRGAPDFADDPSHNLSEFAAVISGGDDPVPRAGSNKLFTVADGQTVGVEYWLYLEGCDENCINEVQSKDVSLKLSFAGVAP